MKTQKESLCGKSCPEQPEEDGGFCPSYRKAHSRRGPFYGSKVQSSSTRVVC